MRMGTMGIRVGVPNLRPAACCRPQQLGALEARPKKVQEAHHGGASCFPWRVRWGDGDVPWETSKVQRLRPEVKIISLNTDPKVPLIAEA